MTLRDFVLVSGCKQPPDVAHLAARLGVKRRVVENDFDFLSGLRFGDRLALQHQRHNFAIGRRDLRVAIENGLLLFAKLLVSRSRRLLLRALPRSPRALALLLHFAS